MSLGPTIAWTLCIVVVALGLALVGQRAGGSGGTLAAARQLASPAALLTLVVSVSLLASVLQGLPAPKPDWVGDARTGDLSQWSAVHAARPEAVRVVDAPTRNGYDKAIEFSVQQGDFTFGSETENRAEVVAQAPLTQATEGTEQWYAWSMLIEEAPDLQPDEWLLLTQWHQDSEACPPNVGLYVVPGEDGPRLRLSVRGGDLDVADCQPGNREAYDLGPLLIGTWQDLRLRVVWSADPDVGQFTVHRDGEQVLEAVSVANLYDGQGVYLKQGIYRSASDDDFSMHITGTVRGSSPASVQLRGCAAARPWELLRRDRAWC